MLVMSARTPIEHLSHAQLTLHFRKKNIQNKTKSQTLIDCTHVHVTLDEEIFILTGFFSADEPFVPVRPFHRRKFLILHRKKHATNASSAFDWWRWHRFNSSIWKPAVFSKYRNSLCAWKTQLKVCLIKVHFLLFTRNFNGRKRK